MLKLNKNVRFFVIKHDKLFHSVKNILKIITFYTQLCYIKNPKLIKATKPFQELGIDFKEPLLYNALNANLLTITDKHLNKGSFLC